jgi:hypothetical protein
MKKSSLVFGNAMLHKFRHSGFSAKWVYSRSCGLAGERKSLSERESNCDATPKRTTGSTVSGTETRRSGA